MQSLKKNICKVVTMFEKHYITTELKINFWWNVTAK